jgi:hypothetical protein
MNQRNMRIPPERYFQKLCGTSMKRVDTFRRTVNSTTESASESVTIYGYHFFCSVRDPARMTGRTGRTHGASMVKIPAKNEAKKRVIEKRTKAKKKV